MVRLINISADTSYDMLMANTSQHVYNVKGNPIQYIHYAPYGEQIANQQTIGYDERFKFTGKERDWEECTFIT